MDKERSFQEILSVGYIYLIAIGILSETFYYKQIGIDILNYSSILDVLISPLGKLTSSIPTLIIFFLLIFLSFQLPKFLVKRRTKKWVQNAFKIDEAATDGQAKSILSKTFLFMLAIGLFGFFIGTGIGNGMRVSKKIKNDELKYNDQIVFIDGDKSQVKIVGINSNYIFYLQKGNKIVQVTPVTSVVKKIEDQ